jgi:signal transduction histidine kinase
MNLHILHFVLGEGDRELPWELDLISRKIVLLKARRPGEATALARAYPLMMIVADLTQWDEHAAEILAQLQALQVALPRPALIGLLRFEPDSERRQALARTPFDALIRESDPARFLEWQIETLQRLHELNHFEQSRMDVNQLAQQTRKKLHDLSQPLSAVQGRLQLLAAKADGAAPNAECLQELVRLTFDVTNHLMEIQRIHRVYS